MRSSCTLRVSPSAALQGVADVGVGELAHLVGGHHVADAHRVLLRGQGAALALESAAHHDFLQFDAFAQGEVSHEGCPFGQGEGRLHGRVAHVAHGDLVGAGIQVGEGVEPVDVADDARVEGFDVDGGTRQGLSGGVHDAATDGALFGLVDVHVILGVDVLIGQDRHPGQQKEEHCQECSVDLFHVFDSWLKIFRKSTGLVLHKFGDLLTDG